MGDKIWAGDGQNSMHKGPNPLILNFSSIFVKYKTTIVYFFIAINAGSDLVYMQQYYFEKKISRNILCFLAQLYSEKYLNHLKLICLS